MRVYVYGPDDRQESKDLLLRLADSISKQHEVVNENLEVSLQKAEKAEVLIARLDVYDDVNWALIGLATAAKMPIVPLWHASYPYGDPFSEDPQKVYGFTKRTHVLNRHWIRKKKDERAWPSTSIDGIVEDLKILEQKKGWRKARREKPGKHTVDLTKPWYIVGDSRTKDDARAFYDIKAGFDICEIETLIPPIALDKGYHPDDFPKVIDMSDSKDVFALASTESAGIVSRIDKRSLMGARWEEGVNFFYSKPGLYLYRYLFPPRFPYEKYLQRQKAGMHYDSVFKQNEELWGIRVHAARTEEELAGVIIRTRNMQKQEQKAKKVA